MVKPLTVYKASAGSGKTFTLATEYIRLVVANPQCYRNILAVTFTNKATEEMKMRILSQLYGIWKRLPDSRSYTEAICRKTGQTEDFVSQRAGMALDNLLHHYSEFRVMTIDTFFQSVLRNLARELDLTANLRIGLNDIQVEELAVDQMIEDLSVTDVLLQWLMKYILESISDDKSWNVIGHIKQFGRTIFRDEYKAVSKALNLKMQEEGFFERYTSQLKDIRQKAKDRMTELAETFFDTLEGEQLSIDDFSYGKTGVCGFFLKLREGTFDESIVGKRVADCVGQPEKWYKRTHPQREAIHTLVESTLDSILRYAIEDRPRQWKLYKSADLTLRHLNQLRLLSSIEKKVRQLNEDANRFLLSDTQQLLHALIDGSDSPFIFEKIGTQLQHVMIDEFQDTSTVQWQNFKVLLEETMSHEGSENLIVGDVKQSIYRWRSGDWRLLNAIERQFPQPEKQIDIRTLDTNYRSHRQVIDFNNAFFTVAAQQEYEDFGESAEAGQLSKAYADVKQNVPADRDKSGYVDIRLLPNDDYQEQTLQAVADIVGQLQQKGIQSNQMAILVRINSLIPLIANYFAEHLPSVTIVSDEAFRLDASPAVNLLISALRLLDRPNDILAKAIVAKIYQQHVGRQTGDGNQLLLKTQQLDELLPEAFTIQTAKLRQLPLYELTEQLYTIFSLADFEGQSAYLCAFYDVMADFLKNNVSGIAGFLAEWDETLCGKTIQSDEINGIRLISIHKSKGLEFPHVIIPFCDWQLEKTQGNILWCKPTEEPFAELPIAPIDYSQKQMTGTIYEADYHHEHLQNTVDNLNLLYVAFTRASQSLFVIGKRGSKNARSALIEKSLPKVAKLMTEATLEGLEDKDQTLSFVYGRLPKPAARQKEKKTDNPFTTPSIPFSVAVRSYEQKVEFRQSNRSKAFVESDNEEEMERQHYIQLGNVLHEIFSTIRTKADIRTALQRLQLEGVLYDEHLTADKISAILSKRLQNPQVATWFSDRWTLFNECTILSLEGDNVKERRPDRVMTDGRQWIVVDFKFGTPKPEHQVQVREYMTLISHLQAFAPDATIEGYLWYVYSNKIIEVKSQA